MVWAFLLLNPVLFLVMGKDDILFDYRIYNCEYGFKSDRLQQTILPIVLFFISALAPNILIVATTIPTLKYLTVARKNARRAQGSIPWQGALTVALTAVVYCISTLPFTFYKIVIAIVGENPESMFQVNYYRVSYFLLMWNIMSNFYIYTLTIKSFRRFLLSTVALSNYFTTENWKSITSVGGKVNTHYIASCASILL